MAFDAYACTMVIVIATLRITSMEIGADDQNYDCSVAQYQGLRFAWSKMGRKTHQTSAQNWYCMYRVYSKMEFLRCVEYLSCESSAGWSRIKNRIETYGSRMKQDEFDSFEPNVWGQEDRRICRPFPHCCLQLTKLPKEVVIVVQLVGCTAGWLIKPSVEPFIATSIFWSTHPPTRIWKIVRNLKSLTVLGFSRSICPIRICDRFGCKGRVRTVL